MTFVDSTVSAVTVYTDRALVTRRSRFPLTGEERDVTLTGLPVVLQTESVRAQGRGTVAVQLLGVRIDRIFDVEPLQGSVAELQQQIRALEDQHQGIKDTVQSLQMQRKFVNQLSEKSVPQFARGLAQQTVGVDQTQQLLNFLGQQYGEYSVAIVQAQRQQEELTRQLEALRQQLWHLETPNTQETYNLIVALAPSAAGEFELEVSYVVDSAIWHPLYDLRLSEAGDRLYLSYLAEVVQSTGEDWTQVALTLSTAKPGLGTLPPKLNPWYIDIPTPPRPQAMQYRAAMAPPARSAAPMGATPESHTTYTEADEDSFETTAIVEAQHSTATVSQEVGTVTFQVGGGGNIPSDNNPHKFTLFSADYPCRLQYTAIPKLVSFAYVQAIVTNPSDGVTWLLGEANIFRGNTFVGTTHLDNIAPGQEFKLNLGIDESLQIKRELVKRDVDKKFLADQRRITYAYRIVVTNLQEREVSLTVTEQIPVSRNEQVKVKLTQSKPAIELGEMNVLEWKLVLLPKAKQEIYYQFTIEHPQPVTVIGLDI